MSRTLIAVLALSLLAACGQGSRDQTPAPTAAQVAQVEELLDAAVARADELEAERLAVFRNLERVDGSLAIGPCPVEIPRPPSAGMLSDDPVGDVGGRTARATRMSVIRREDAGEAPSPLRAEFDTSVERVRAALAPDYGHRSSYESGERLIERARELGSDDFWDYALMVVAYRYRAARSRGDADFESGTIVGAGYVWSYRDHRIACAARVVAQNSETLPNHGPGTGDIDLELDLENEAYRAALRNLGGLPSAPEPSPAPEALPGTGDDVEPTSAQDAPAAP